jgi:hypothetical protein
LFSSFRSNHLRNQFPIFSNSFNKFLNHAVLILGPIFCMIHSSLT